MLIRHQITIPEEPWSIRKPNGYGLNEQFVIFPLSSPGLGYVRSMAILASLGGRFIEQDKVPIHRLLERMAGRAGYIFMAAFKRKCGLVVIEERGPPLMTIVTSCTVVAACAELVPMRICVAIPAIHRGFCEVDVPHVGFHVRWLVALCTVHRAMRTQ